MRWSKSKDGKQRVNVRIEWRFSREDLANLLCARLAADSRPVYDDQGRVGLDEYNSARDRWEFSLALSATRVLREIREQLSLHGADTRHWWRDKFETYTGEPTADEMYAWALKQVNQL